jgi:hypothetical protein
MKDAKELTNEGRRGRLAYRVDEFARMSGLSPNFVRLEIARKNLDAFRRGRCVLIPAAAGERYLSVEA